MNIKSLIKENPDAVRNESGKEIATVYDDPNVAFIVYRTEDDQEKPIAVKYIYSKEHLTGGGGLNEPLRKIIKKENEGINTSELIQGRIWITERLASIYQYEADAREYALQMESMFKDLELNIDDFLWDFADSPQGKFKKWVHYSTPTKYRREMTPELRKKINDLIQKLHTATPDEKVTLRWLIKRYQEEAGIEEDEIDAMFKANQEKLDNLLARMVLLLKQDFIKEL